MMRAPTPQDLVESETDAARSDVTPPTPLRTRTASGTQPPGRRRHTVEEPIESGEIVERRSLVIRSQPVPTIEWNEGPTEIAAQSLPAVETRSRRVLWLAAAVACGVIAIVFALRAQPDATNVAALEARAEMMGTMLDGEARAAMVRAEAMATSPVLRAAIETDADTLADMARDRDVAFSLGKGEVIEVYQVRTDARRLLLRLPADAKPLEAPAAGQARIESGNSNVTVIAAAPIANERSKIAGEIVISTPIDLGPVSKRIAEHASGAVVTGLDQAIVMIDSKTVPNVTLPIHTRTPVAGSLSLAAVVRQPTASSAYAWIFMSASAVLLAIFVVSLVRSRRAA